MNFIEWFIGYALQIIKYKFAKNKYSQNRMRIKFNKGNAKLQNTVVLKMAHFQILRIMLFFIYMGKSLNHLPKNKFEYLNTYRKLIVSWKQIITDDENH